jgi:hypothetical protein
VAAAEAYITQQGLADVQVEVETSSMEQVQQVSCKHYLSTRGVSLALHM